MIVLRQGRDEDWQAIQALLTAADMLGDLDPGECLLAEEGASLAGLARIEYSGGSAYLRPIAVASAYQGQGVGRRLIDALHAREDQIRVVARGSAAGFYEAVGFRPMDWEMVEPAFQAECTGCPKLADCKPIALIYRRTNK